MVLTFSDMDTYSITNLLTLREKRMHTQSLITISIGVLMASATYSHADEQADSGLLVLNGSASGALSMTGNSQIEIPARLVYVNSSAADAVKTNGTAVLDAPSLYVVGGVSFGGQSECTGDVFMGSPGIYDPLQARVFPESAEMENFGGVDLSSHGEQVTLSPGFYPDGIKITGQTNVTFAPGVFILGGVGLVVTSGDITGDGVCLVVSEGTCKLAGSSSMQLSPMDSGEMQGIVLAQPASNTSDMNLAGGSEFSILGTIYAPKAKLLMVGNSTIDGEGPQMGDLVIADQVDLRGTAMIRIGQKEGTRVVSFPTQPLYD